MKKFYFGTLASMVILGYNLNGFWEASNLPVMIERSDISTEMQKIATEYNECIRNPDPLKKCLEFRLQYDDLAVKGIILENTEEYKTAMSDINDHKIYSWLAALTFAGFVMHGAAAFETHMGGRREDEMDELLISYIAQF